MDFDAKENDKLNSNEEENDDPLNEYGAPVCETYLESIVSTKTWNDLKPPTTTYNHLKNFNNHLQPPQKHLQPLANHLKQGINVYNKARRQHVTYMKCENRTKPPPPPEILLCLAPCVINYLTN